MNKIRVLVADDSAFMRKIVTDLLKADPLIEVSATAKNGVEVVSIANLIKPDVITLDVEMPEMDGLTALKQIVEMNIPVIMVSSLTQTGASTTLKALEIGAFDFVAKPSALFSSEYSIIQQELIEKIKEATRSKTKKARPILEPIVPRKRKIEVNSRPAKEVIAIGTSTGGPKALQTLLSQLPTTLSAGIVIVQHMPPGFTKSLAQRLNDMCNIKVVEAESGQSIKEGVAYIAPGGWHLEVKKSDQGVTTYLHQNERRLNHRPSVDVLFESLANIPSIGKHYCLLTGMGSDGAEGMKQAKKMGAKVTIAEHESTCVVYGMPRAAMKLNCVDWVLPLHQIADKLIESVER